MVASGAHPRGLGPDLDRALELCAAEMKQLDRATIYLTGGTGIVGSWLLELLTWSADRLGTAPRAVVLTRDPAAFRASRPHLAGHRAVHLVAGDVRRPPGMVTADFMVAGASASLAAGDARSDDDVVATQLSGADVARRFLDRGSRVLFLSSGAAAGGRDSYAVAKRRAEAALTASPDGPAAVVARLYTFVGPYLPLDLAFAVGNFHRDALAGGPITVKGDGTSVRSYLYVADLARWLWVLLLRGRAGAIYDVGGARAVSIRDLAESIGSLRRPPVPVRVLGADVASSAGNVYLPDLGAVRGLGLHESWDLPEALERSWRWLVDDPGPLGASPPTSGPALSMARW